MTLACNPSHARSALMKCHVSFPELEILRDANNLSAMLFVYDQFCGQCQNSRLSAGEYLGRTLLRASKIKYRTNNTKRYITHLLQLNVKMRRRMRCSDLNMSVRHLLRKVYQLPPVNISCHKCCSELDDINNPSPVHASRILYIFLFHSGQL